MEKFEIQTIAHIRSPFGEKFGIPRQSNLVDAVSATIVFEPEYRNAEALRGIEEFEYLWLIWQFSENRAEGWHATVRPPRLGGNKRMGVFATRSPFRPNGLGLSSVRLTGVTLHSEEGPLLHVSGADLMDGTPIVDIKPYVAYCDAHAGARSGFASERPEARLTVEWKKEFGLPESVRNEIAAVVALDPRPSYQNDAERVYGMHYGPYEVHFQVVSNRAEITSIEKVR